MTAPPSTITFSSANELAAIAAALENDTGERGEALARQHLPQLQETVSELVSTAQRTGDSYHRSTSSTARAMWQPLGDAVLTGAAIAVPMATVARQLSALLRAHPAYGGPGAL